jgi:hypothetical protein
MIMRFRPANIQTFTSQGSVEAFNEGVVCWLAWPGEVDVQIILPRGLLSYLREAQLRNPDQIGTRPWPYSRWRTLTNGGVVFVVVVVFAFSRVQGEQQPGQIRATIDQSDIPNGSSI